MKIPTLILLVVTGNFGVHSFKYKSKASVCVCVCVQVTDIAQAIRFQSADDLDLHVCTERTR